MTFKKFASKNAVMLIAFFAALITCFLVPPDKEYAAYFDVKTLSCLFSVLAVVCALKNINFFYILARKIVALFKTAKLAILARPDGPLYGIQHTNGGKIVIFGGGDTLELGGKILGGLGVSGGSAEQDTELSAYGKRVFEEYFS